MAKLSFGITGNVRGSVNNLTFAVVRGTNYVKQKATEVANPKTLGQRIQRNRFSAILEVYQMLRGFINEGFKSVSTTRSEYNSFMSKNIVPATSNPTADEIEVEFDKLQVSAGTLQETQVASVTGSDGLDVVGVGYATSSIGSQESTDIARALVINSTNGEIAYSGSSTDRSAGNVLVTMPSDLSTGDELHVYLFFKNPNTGKTSVNSYETYTV